MASISISFSYYDETKLFHVCLCKIRLRYEARFILLIIYIYMIGNKKCLIDVKLIGDFDKIVRI